MSKKMCINPLTIAGGFVALQGAVIIFVSLSKEFAWFSLLGIALILAGTLIGYISIRKISVDSPED
jgi:hypothetical protein